MFCSKCGKEITDDSIFCYSCGSKVEIKKKQDTVTDTPPPIVNITTPHELQNTTREKIGVSLVTDKVENTKEQTISDRNNSNQEEDKKKKHGYGWVILFCLSGSFLFKWIKDYDPSTYSTITLILTFLCLPIIFILYFTLRNILLRRKFFVGKVGLSSFISGFVSFIFVMSIIGFLIGWDNASYKRKEINEYVSNVKKQNEIFNKQQIEYSKMMESEPKTRAEENAKILKIDEYKNFLMNVRGYFHNYTNFFRKINSKYKKDKSLDEQINKLEIMFIDNNKTSIDSLDMYKKYLITGDQKYYKLYEQKYEESLSGKEEFTKLVTNISKSL